MKLLVALCFCLLALGLFAVEGAEVCRFGESWKCSSSDCEKRCDTLNKGAECTQACTNGCYCDPGFVREVANVCSPQFVCRYKNSSGRRVYA